MMPYIQEDRREKLDEFIEELRYAIVKQIPVEKRKGNVFHLTPEQLLEISGDLNYCISRICASLICDPSYGKIAIITGVLDNIKLELYRRIGSDYENQKIESNGDIPEYKNYNYK